MKPVPIVNGNASFNCIPSRHSCGISELMKLAKNGTQPKIQINALGALLNTSISTDGKHKIQDLPTIGPLLWMLNSSDEGKNYRTVDNTLGK